MLCPNIFIHTATFSMQILNHLKYSLQIWWHQWLRSLNGSSLVKNHVPGVIIFFYIHRQCLLFSTTTTSLPVHVFYFDFVLYVPLPQNIFKILLPQRGHHHHYWVPFAINIFQKVVVNTGLKFFNFIAVRFIGERHFVHLVSNLKTNSKIIDITSNKSYAKKLQTVQKLKFVDRHLKN